MEVFVVDLALSGDEVPPGGGGRGGAGESHEDVEVDLFDESSAKNNFATALDILSFD